MDEIWKSIDEYPNYEVSNHGRIRNIKTDRILRTFLNPKGYEIVTLSHKGVQKTECVHILVANAFVEKYYDDLDVAHLDNNRVNNRADNLDWWKRRDVHRRSFRLRGRQQLHRMKPIRVVETGEVFKSITEASEILGISRDSISRVVNQRSRCTKNGLHFEEIEWW